LRERAQRSGLILAPLDLPGLQRRRRGQQDRHHTVVAGDIAHFATFAIDDHFDSSRLPRTLERGSDNKSRLPLLVAAAEPPVRTPAANSPSVTPAATSGSVTPVVTDGSVTPATASGSIVAATPAGSIAAATASGRQSSKGRGPTFLIHGEPDGSWLARPEGSIRHLSDGRLVRGWNDVNTLRREWRAQAHWSGDDHVRFVAEFGDPR
jgi:hypothetical protein